MERESIDFLLEKELFNGDIITNPPYSYGGEFVRKAIELSNRKVAMFLRIQFLESKGRYELLFSKYKPSKVLVFVKRMKCFPNNEDTIGSSAICYAWFVWDKEYKGSTVLDWIDNR